MRVSEIEQDDSVNEQSLALSWQIPRSALATVRKSRLREHWHWKYGPSKNHGDIRITKEGIEELKKWVVPPDRPVKVEAPDSVRMSKGGEVITSGPVAKLPLDVLPPGELPPENILVVFRVPPNPRMLICRDCEGKSVSVRVNANFKFRAGMKIDKEKQCVRLAVDNYDYTVYAFKGKLPRFPGRW